MTIKIITKESRQTVLPKDFQAGKVYQSKEDPSYLVLGIRKTYLDGVGRAESRVLVGIGLDSAGDPWYMSDTHETQTNFIEVNITVTVEN